MWWSVWCERQWSSSKLNTVFSSELHHQTLLRKEVCSKVSGNHRHRLWRHQVSSQTASCHCVCNDVSYWALTCFICQQSSGSRQRNQGEHLRYGRPPVLLWSESKRVIYGVHIRRNVWNTCMLERHQRCCEREIGENSQIYKKRKLVNS